MSDWHGKPDPAAVPGFFNAERMGVGMARWTSHLAVIAIPHVATVASSVALTARLAAVRPPGVQPPSVRVELEDLLIGVTPPLGPEFREVTLPVPPDVLARLTTRASRLSIRTPTFVPADHGTPGDTRHLGVTIDWVRLDAR